MNDHGAGGHTYTPGTVGVVARKVEPFDPMKPFRLHMGDVLFIKVDGQENRERVTHVDPHGGTIFTTDARGRVLTWDARDLYRYAEEGKLRVEATDEPVSLEEQSVAVLKRIATALEDIARLRGK